MTQGDSNASDLMNPAVTICPKVSTKDAIAERLGNFINPMNLPQELLSLRHEFFMCAIGLTKKELKLNYYSTYKKLYEINCIEEYVRSDSCKVRNIKSVLDIHFLNYITSTYSKIYSKSQNVS